MNQNFDLTLLDILPQMKTGTGFFSKFAAPVWAEEYTNTAALDIFFAMTYGQKHPAPLLMMFVDDTTGKIGNEDLAAIATMLYEIRGHEWAKLYDVLTAEYNPLDNTDVTETIHDITDIDKGNSNTRTLNTQTDNTGDGSVATTGTASGNTAGNVFGFDSATAVGDTTGTNGSNTSSTTTTQTSNQIIDSGTIGDVGTGTEDIEYEREYHKHGNIGVMTFADLINGSIEAWKWTFIIQVMNDICSLTTLSVY